MCYKPRLKYTNCDHLQILEAVTQIQCRLKLNTKETCKKLQVVDIPIERCCSKECCGIQMRKSFRVLVQTGGHEFKVEDHDLDDFRQEQPHSRGGRRVLDSGNPNQHEQYGDRGYREHSDGQKDLDDNVFEEHFNGRSRGEGAASSYYDRRQTNDGGRDKGPEHVRTMCVGFDKMMRTHDECIFNAQRVVHQEKKWSRSQVEDYIRGREHKLRSKKLQSGRKR